MITILPQSIFSRVAHFGLSISTAGVRGVMVDQKGTVVAYKDSAASELLFQPDMVNEAELVKCLKQLIDELKPTTPYAAISFPEKLAFTRKHSLPKIERHEIIEAIQWQLPKIFPLKTDEIYVDWMLADSSDSETSVVVTAIPKVILDGFVSACTQAGIKPISFAPSTSVLSRLIQPAPESAVIIELDLFGSTCTLINQGVSILTSTTSFPQQAPIDSIVDSIISAYSSIIQKAPPGKDAATNTIPIYIVGEAVAEQISQLMTQKLNQPATLLTVNGLPSTHLQAYGQALSAIKPPENDTTINVLPQNLQHMYNEDAEYIQLRAVAKYGISFATAAAIVAFAIFAFTTLQLNQSQAHLASIPPPPTTTADLNIAQISTKAQKVVALQPVKTLPVQGIVNVLQNFPPQLINQFRFDAAKSEIKISTGNVSREQLIALKDQLETLDSISQVSIPLSAFGSTQSDINTITIRLKKE